MRLLLLTLSLAACGVPLQDYPDEAAESYCERALACGELAENDLQQCIDATSGLLQLSVDFQDSAAYDPGQAGRCVRELGRLDCETLDIDDANACDTVFDDG